MNRDRDLPRWPNARASRFARVAPHDWHIQEMGAGRTLLLLHGAGGSTHSWRAVLPLLAERWHVVAIDLPGQGFTKAGTLTRAGLRRMSDDIRALIAAQGWQIDGVVGHSAGAALALDLSRHLPGPPPIVGFNAALAQFEGMASWLFPLLAQLLSLNPFTATIFTMGRNHQGRAKRLIEGTGSKIDAEGLTCYAALISDRTHVNATLQMMTRWRIEDLVDQLADVTAPVLLITGSEDRAVPPQTSARAATTLPNAQTVTLEGLGHLAHEEAPEIAVARIEAFLNSQITGIVRPQAADTAT